MIRAGNEARLRALACVLLALFCGGCAVSPSIPVFGAGFPAWLFAMIGGVVATVIVHLLLSATRLTRWFEPLELSYPGLAAIFSALIWLAVFAH